MEKISMSINKTYNIRKRIENVAIFLLIISGIANVILSMPRIPAHLIKLMKEFPSASLTTICQFYNEAHN